MHLENEISVTKQNYNDEIAKDGKLNALEAQKKTLGMEVARLSTQLENKKASISEEENNCDQVVSHLKQVVY